MPSILVNCRRARCAYAYDLLHFARWLQSQPQAISEVTESTLLDYVRHQLNQEPQPAPQTVNHRLTVIRCLYRFHHGQEIPVGHSHFQRTLRRAARSALATPIAPWPSASASSNRSSSSNLYLPSKSRSFGRAFVPSGILPWWA